MTLGVYSHPQQWFHHNAQWSENRKSVRFLVKKLEFFFSLELQIRLCMGDIGYMRPASAASEAISWYVLFVVPKNHRRKHFSRSWHYSKLAQRPRFRGTGWPQIWPPRPFEAVRGQNRVFAEIFKSWKNRCSQPFAIRFSTILSPQEYVVSEYICQ